MATKLRKFLLSIILFIGVALFMGNVDVKASTYQNDSAKTYNILVISIDPTLTHPSGGKFGNGQSTIKESEYLGFTLNESVQFLKSNLEDISHGTVKFNIVNTITLNEFAQLKTQEQMTSTKFFKYFPVQSNGYGNWYNGVCKNAEYNSKYTISFGDLDYTHIISACDLVNRKNNGEFDMVWIFGNDPLSPYETCMAGRKAFWVNGQAITADCDNFVMATMTFSRKDGSLEDIGHLSEQILNKVYGTTVSYSKNYLDGSDLSKLNTWQKFALCDYVATSNTTKYGLGLVHFSPNSTADYEWGSETPVSSFYQDFIAGDLNSIGSSTTNFTYSSAYKGNTGSRYNQSNPDYYYSSKACIEHHRWWFGAMPHYAGRDKDGYSNNWWEYIMNPDYVSSLSSNTGSTTITLAPGEEYDLKFIANYYSGKKPELDAVTSEAAIYISSNGCIDYINGNIQAKSVGTGIVNVRYDGRILALTIKVEEKTNPVNPVNPVDPEDPVVPVDPVVPMTSVKFTYAPMQVCEGVTFNLGAEVYPEEARKNCTITYTINDTSIATVTSSGVVTTLKGGVTGYSIKVVDGKGNSRTARSSFYVEEHDSNTSSYMTIKKATTTKDGYYEYKCSKCDRRISKKAIKRPKKVTLSKTTYTYSGKSCKPTVTVTDAAGQIIAGSNYTIKYSSCKDVGTATAKVILDSDIYSGKMSVAFKIVPAKTSFVSVSSGAGYLKANIKSQKVQTTGYEVCTARDSGFTDSVKSVKVDNTATSIKVKGLKSTKKYYVRVRTYKVIGDKTYYSGWTVYEKQIKIK